AERGRGGGGGDEHRRVHRYHHRMPAASERAIDARTVNAQETRISRCFTLIHLCPNDYVAGPATGRPQYLQHEEYEVPGFASPPRGGFALDGPSTEGVLRPR